MNLLASALLVGFTLHAQPDLEDLERRRESQRQVTAYIAAKAREITDRAIGELNDPAQWDRLRTRRTEEMRDMLGLFPWPARTPLNLRKTGTIDAGDYTVEKIVFESLPKVYVTANLYLPKQRPATPLPAVVYVCGHAFDDYGAKTYYQRHGISLARNGYVAFLIDPIQIAEAFALHHGVWNQELYDWYSRGYTPAGVEVWNAIRAIDYLESRPEVDRTRIGMTGRSGGAAMTLFTASVEPRIKVAVAAMGFNTYAATVGAANRMHCDCMFPINTYLHDLMTPSALISPRPLLLTHGRLDASFPVAGYEEAAQHIGALYSAYGKGDQFRNLVVETGHADSDFQREQAILWFDRFLKQHPQTKPRLDYTEHPHEQLAALGSNVPTDARNFLVHEILNRPPAPAHHTPASWQSRRAQLLGLLRTKVFPAFPQTLPPPVALSAGTHEFESEPGIQVRYHLELPEEPDTRHPALVYIASDGEDLRAIRDFLTTARSRARAARLIIYPRGVGVLGWEKSFWKATLRDAMHIGQTVDSMRLYDVMRAADSLAAHSAIDPRRIILTGRGTAAALGLYAAILDPRIAQVLLIDPPETHALAPIFLNVLRYTDLAETAGLMAPRRLAFYGRVPPAFDYTRHIFAIAGKTANFFQTTSLAALIDERLDHGFSSGY